MIEYDWLSAPKKIIKSEMAKRNMTQLELANRLTSMGIPETKISIGSKLSRGTFGAIFFFQCMKAMGVSHLALTDDFFISSEKE